MSSYNSNSLRKRRSDDESSESDDEEYPPPVKKSRNCNGESNIKNILAAKYQSAISWISELQVNNYFKQTLLNDQVEVEMSDNESDELAVVPEDEIEALTQDTDLDSQHNNQDRNSLLLDSLKRLPKPLSASTPCYRDGTLVGIPGVKKKINGFHGKSQKSQMEQKPKRSNGQRTLISNPSVDIEILLDSSKSDSADDPGLRKLPYSAFTRQVMSPIPVSSNDLEVDSRRGSVNLEVDSRRGSVNCTSPCSSTSSMSVDKLFTAEKVIRLKEKEDYQQLLAKMVRESIYHPVKAADEAKAIQVDLTHDDHEEAVMGCYYNKEILRKPVNEFLEKYYKPCQLVKKTVKCAPKIEDEPRENIPPSTSMLPEHRPIEKRSMFFTSDWLRELKVSINEETEHRMESVKQEERIIQRLKARREAKHEEEKRLFDKFKVPGDVFPEPGGGRNDYPELTPQMENMVNAALQRNVGNENDELSTFDSVTVTRRHMLTLLEATWLIDEVLNFYFNLIVARSKLDNYPSVYAFNTFFYASVSSRGVNSVLRWTRKVDIFSYDIIFVPLHLGVHWALCVIDNRKKTITYYDSMGSGHDQCLHTMQNYLVAEMKSKKNIVMDPNEYSLEVAKDLPQQMNGSDCGMFTLKYAEYISRDAPITFKQVHMNYFRRRMVYEILTKQLM